MHILQTHFGFIGLWSEILIFKVLAIWSLLDHPKQKFIKLG